MAKVGTGVGWWHPRTEFRVRATWRTTVVTVDGASRLRPVVDVDLTAGVVPDLDARQTAFFDVGVLEKLDLQLAFDDRGLLESVNAQSGRDLTPVLSVVGKLVGLTTAGRVGFAPVDDPLEVAWDRDHATLAALRASLYARVASLLDRLVATGTTPDQIVQLGAALAVLEGYQASIGQLRREWIAARAGVVDVRESRLRPAELVRVAGTPELPDELDHPVVPAAQEDLAGAGVLLAVADPLRPAQRAVRADAEPDRIVLRGSRPARAGVYRRDDDDRWMLERDTVLDLDVVDEFSPDDVIPLDGSWLRTRTFSLAYHPDRSLKTFGFASTPSASAIATGLGGTIDSVTAATKAWNARPSASAAELDRLQTQLGLARASGELELLAATRSRATELAVLEQQQKLHAAGA